MVVWWQDRDTLRMWQNDPRHLAAKNAGRRYSYEWYKIEVAEVVRPSRFDKERENAREPGRPMNSEEERTFEGQFLANDSRSKTAYRAAMKSAIETLCTALPTGPYSGRNPAALDELLDGQPLPEMSVPLGEVLQEVADVVANCVAVWDCNVAAHFQAPPLIPALAGELILSALNQSMDSFDQSPAGTMLELKLHRWLCKEVGFPEGASGTFTTGGTQSNYMALMLARDLCLEGRRRRKHRLRVLCSEAAHFSVEKSAAQLGLGTGSVIRVGVDDRYRMSIPDLKEKCVHLDQQGWVPMAIVATAGTTDFGSVDSISEISDCAHNVGAWFHVDAAYGGAVLFSRSQRSLLKGLELADSISIDFHKLLWQPVSCAAFLLRDSKQFRFIKLHSDYLNPATEDDVIPHLVSNSLLTTRRFDALKLWISLKTVGREKLGQMIDRTFELASHASRTILRSKRLQRMHEPMLGCLVFRYVPQSRALDADEINQRIRNELFETGRAVIGRTRVRGTQCLKLTFMNPLASEEQISKLIEEIERVGEQAEAALTPGC